MINDNKMAVHRPPFFHCLRFEVRLGLLLGITTGREGGCSCERDDSDASVLMLLGDDCSLGDEGAGVCSLNVWV